MIALLLTAILFADAAADGERAYRAGSYKEALVSFESALQDAEAPQGRLFYNIGNCHYRLGEFPQAVLDYRKAQLRMPRDPQLKFNLNLAEQQLGVQSAKEESFFSAVGGLLDSFTPGELAVAVFLLEMLGLICAIVFSKRKTLRNAMLCLVVLGLVGATQLLSSQLFPPFPSGVVLASEVGLRSEPRSDLPTTLRLKAGESLRIEERSDRWVKVRHNAGSGWTESSGIGVVD